MKLQGISDNVHPCTEVTLNPLTTMEKDESVWGIVQVYSIQPETPAQPDIPPAITTLIYQYADIFLNLLVYPQSDLIHILSLFYLASNPSD